MLDSLQRLGPLLFCVAIALSFACERSDSPSPKDTAQRGDSRLEQVPTSGRWISNGAHAYETGRSQHRLKANVTPGALSVRKLGANWSFAMRWTSMSIDGASIQIPAVMASSIDGSRAIVHRGEIEEWYDNHAVLEHGFTLERAPEGATQSIEFGFELDEAQMLRSGKDGVFHIATTRGQTLRYSDLRAFDATGRDLPAQIIADGSSTFSILVDLAGAVYPVVVDPGIVLEDTIYYEPGGSISFQHFGSSLAVNQTWAVAGAKWDDEWGADSGILYAYRRNPDGSLTYDHGFTKNNPNATDSDYMGQGKLQLVNDTKLFAATPWADTLAGTYAGGALFGFDLVGGTFEQVFELRQSPEAGTSYFARNFHWADDILVVSSSLDPQGFLNIYTTTPGKPFEITLDQTIQAVDTTTEICGVATVRGDLVAYVEEDPVINAWYVKILKRIGGIWTPVFLSGLINARPGGYEFDSPGETLGFSPSGDTLYAFFHNTSADMHGYVFERAGVDNWSQTADVLLGGGGGFDGTGFHAIDDNSVLIATLSEDIRLIERDHDATANEWGVTRIYETTTNQLIGEQIAWVDGWLYGSSSEDNTNSGALYAWAPCNPEICDGIDNDCNGVIDDGMADNDCAVGQSCVYGGCFEDCAMTADCGGQTCYTDLSDTICNDTADACTNISCATGMICYSGGCFDACSSDAECDPLNERCYNAGRCGDANDPCAGVFCPVEQICYGGGCFQSCSADVDCSSISPSHACFDGRCAVDACDAVDCPVGQICYGGTCFDDCTSDAYCSGACYDAQRCAADACEGVQCPTSQICYGGSCFDTCSDNASCAGDCYAGHCATDPCDGVQCGTEEVCHAGSCFTVCSGTDPCSDPNSICYDNRCVDEDDPLCDGVVCRVGEACFQGDCFTDCSNASDCTDPNSQCYQDTCISTDCSTVTCLGSQTCYEGVCFENCTTDVDCSQTDHVCWEGRCATDPCEALADSDIAAYESASIVKNKDRVVLAFQDSTPWSYPRPIRGTNFTSYVNMSGKSSQAPVHESQKGRVVLYYDEDENGGSYIVWLTHGKLGAQSPVEVAYTVRGRGEVAGEVYFVDDGDESHQRETDDGDWFIQSLISSELDTTGGIAFGPFEADKNWEMRIIASFSGDILDWELWDEETQETTTLNLNEALVIKNTSFPSARRFTPTTGTTCMVDSEEGVCRRGTRLECRNGWLRCQQTVYPSIVEVCDGLDNDCDGLTDNFDPDLQIPQAYVRQDGQFGWRQLATYDSSQTIVELMEFEPRMTTTSIRGSSKPKTREGPLIADDLYGATFFVHRSLQSGMLDFAWIAGEEGNTSGGSEFPLIWEIKAFNTTTMDDYGISWYEDRNQNDGERIIQDLKNDERSYEIKHNLEFAYGAWETESDALRMLWNGNDTFVSVDLETNDNDDGGDLDLKYYQPYYGKTDVHDRRKVRLKIAGTPLDATVCVATSPTGAGCALSRYSCSPAGLLCGAADDAVCNGCVDADMDGFDNLDPVNCPSGDDCDDNDPTVYPGATEVCDGIDNDCDGRADLTAVGCPAGMAECGPQECNYNLSCICPEGPMIDSSVAPCKCGAGLSP